MNQRPIGIAYLIGAGSMTLGVEKAGINVTGVWETPGYAKNAKTWEMNRPGEPVTVLELDHKSNYFKQFQGLDLIYGNPPCGGLSAMTCSRLESPTNNCMRQWMRMVVQARPRMILMENAYQLATDRAKSLLSDLTEVLEGYGYHWWTWMMYAYQIGTPQIRRRAFLCASLDELKRPWLQDLADISHMKKTATPCGPVLESLNDIEPSPEAVTDTDGNYVTQHWYGCKHVPHLNELLTEHRERLRLPYVTLKDLEGSRRRAAEGCPKAVKEIERICKRDLLWEECPKEFGGMSMHRPNNTWYDRAAPAVIGAYRLIHPTRSRFLTMREMARLMGYPDSWQFHKLNPSLIAQGIPANSARWATERLLQTVGFRA